nr:hypothetical protein [uncultured archaeon]AQS34287.1 hypothetical protein [uncultured archaeon]AQS34744.1 hypothetical protein [uncultured archaeon]
MISLSSYPKCSCGGEFVPLTHRKRFKEPEVYDEEKLAEEEVLIWRCVKCEKVVEMP